MSLLTSLIRASTQFQQAMERKPSAENTSTGKTGRTDSLKPEAAGSPGDDRFTPSGLSADDLASAKSRKLAMTDYRQTVGQDLAFVKETLRHKLAEYNVHPATAVEVNKSSNGTIGIAGSIPDEARARIENDLNINTEFKNAFNRLSVNEPTLHFVDTALKLNQAYGVNNPVLETLISENQQFNGLQDLVHRYDSLRRTVSSELQPSTGSSQDYAFSLNARA